MPSHRHPDLPPSELTARIALAAAGLSGNRQISQAIHRHGSATAVVAEAYDRVGQLPDDLSRRIRELGTPTAVVRALEHTRHARMRILLPDDLEWPSQLRVLGNAAPLLLWLPEPPVAITGAARPSDDARQVTVEIATRLADAGWVVAATSRPGVDAQALLAADRVGGSTITIAGAPRALPENGRALLVSENPPGLPLLVGSALRGPVLLAALAGKVLIAEAQIGSGAIRTGVAAHALDRPLGILDIRTGGSRLLRARHGARLVRTLADAERLS